jgi:hypothetical protein
VSLWFVTPAWQRYDIVAICLEQRARAIDELGRHGIEAHQVVIADDENLDIARGLGCHTVERDNEMVGRKFNDGMEYAGAQGAEWIVPIGSDSWIDPAFFLPLTTPRYTLTSTAYCAVRSGSLAQLDVSPRRLDHAAGPYVFHRSLLAPAGFRPSKEDSVMVDTDTIAGIRQRRSIRWEPRTVHPFQYIGFRVEPMMTTYHSLRRRWLVVEHKDPWQRLAQHFPRDLVDRARVVIEGAGV